MTDTYREPASLNLQPRVWQDVGFAAVLVEGGKLTRWVEAIKVHGGFLVKVNESLEVRFHGVPYTGEGATPGYPSYPSTGPSYSPSPEMLVFLPYQSIEEVRAAFFTEVPA
jgi:hypothetical protein